MQHDAYDVIHDCLVDRDVNPTEARIQKVYDKLAYDVKILAEQWGWHDTEVREAVGAFIRVNKGAL